MVSSFSRSAPSSPAAQPAGSLGLALSNFLRPHDFFDDEDRRSFWQFMLVGILPGAALLALLGFTAATLYPLASGVAAAVWVCFAVLAIWWALSLVAASWRRLEDAWADPRLAFGLFVLPYVWAGGALYLGLASIFGLVPLPTETQTMIAVSIGSFFALVTLAITVIALAAPSGGAGWTGERMMFWLLLASNPFVTGILFLLWLVIKPLALRIVRPNLGTRLLLLACFIGLFLLSKTYPEGTTNYSWVPTLDRGVRTFLTLLVGGLFIAVHIWRWAMQEVHFSGTKVAVRFAGQAPVYTKDDRWLPIRSRAFKVCGLIWIIMCTIGIITRAPSSPCSSQAGIATECSAADLAMMQGYGTMEMVWILLVVGFVSYLGLPPIFIATWVVQIGGLLLLGFGLGADPASSADQAFRTFGIVLIVVWGPIYTLFAYSYHLNEPTDGRRNHTRDYRRYLATSEW